MEHRVDLTPSRCMHDPSFMACPYSFRENDLNTKKVYAAAADDDDNDDAGKAIHMPRFCFAGETKTEILNSLFTYSRFSVILTNT